MSSLIEEEFEKYNRESKWEQVFNKLHNEATLHHGHTSRDAKKTENKERNRYRDVHPYDHSRVRLQGYSNDYINASHIDVPLAGRKYILTQGPLPTTCGHFWRMIWQQNTKGVVMLNKIIEKGHIKCHQYFPEGAENGDVDDIEFPDVGVRVELLSTKDCSYYVVRAFRLFDTESGETRTVTQFHYVTWPDFGVPQSPDAFLAFLKVVRESGCLDSSAGGPAVIHCSAGIGRSGTFCLVDCALLLVSRTRSRACLALRSMLVDMRRYRAGLVQTADQLRFCYLAVLKGAERILVDGDSLGCTNDSGDDAAAVDIPPAWPSTIDQDLVAMAAPSEGDLLQPPPLPQRSSSLLRSSLPKSLSLDDRAPMLPQRASCRENMLPLPPPPRTPHQSDSAERLQRANSLPVKPCLPRAASDGGSEGDVASRTIVISGKNPIELRRRRKEERLKNTAEQIQKMRRKQQESELLRSGRTSRSGLPPWANFWTASVTVAAVAVAGYLYYNYF